MVEEKSYQEIRKELVQKYKTEVVPKLAIFEKERNVVLKNIKKYKIIIFSIYFIGIFLIIYYSISTNIRNLLFLIHFSIFLFFIAAICYPKFTGRYKYSDKINKEIIPLICSCFLDLTWAFKYEFIDTTIYKKANIFPMIESILCHNYFEGSYKDVKFTIKDVEVSQLGYKFYGCMIELNINKNFKGNTVIHPDFIRYKYNLNNMHVTELEDVVFEKQYKVFTDDDVEARYLITPSFINRVNTLKNKFDTDYIYLAFYNNMLYIAMRSKKELFQITSFKKDIYNNQYYKFIEEIISIYKLIDYFKLDQNIGM